MSLTVGTGPFAKKPAGRFNIDIDRSRAVILWDPVPHRVRAIFAGETVVDSLDAVLLHETGHLPVYYFPEKDLRADLLEPSDKTTTCPHKGEAGYRTVRVGRRTAPDAIWAYAEPIDSAPFLAGYAALDWNSFDEWFVEDEQAFGHPRDPYSRIDVYKAARHVRVLLEGQVLADSRRARILFETGLPPRYYLPIEDVRTELLLPSSKKTRCAYKGSASYWHVRVPTEAGAGGNGERHSDREQLVEDLVWTYPDPQHDAESVRDMLCFFNERVDLEIDNQLGERPTTQFSDSAGGLLAARR